ncbi:MAG: PD-(D/E)XK nuclease family protein [Parvibaculales bacterium]
MKAGNEMARHRGQFDPKNPEPYELSRSRIENFVRCPACFYMQQVEKIQFPSIPGFLLNEATDVLLKTYFDKFRSAQECPDYLKDEGYKNFIPFQHVDFELWTQSLHFGASGRMHTIVEEYNLKVGGGLDDVWYNTDSGKLHIVDYKSTSKKTNGPDLLDGYFAQSYKRQMDFYVWVMRRMGFDVSDTGYFLYVNGDRDTNTNFLQAGHGIMEFKVSLLPYDVSTDWVDGTLAKIKDTLHSPVRPNHSENCDYGAFLYAAG